MLEVTHDIVYDLHSPAQTCDTVRLTYDIVG
jgi:hypothetical protein